MPEAKVHISPNEQTNCILLIIHTLLCKEVVEICQPILSFLLKHGPISFILSRHFKITDTENKLAIPEKTDIMQRALNIKLLNALKILKTWPVLSYENVRNQQK
jgi:hypothetical protein